MEICVFMTQKELSGPQVIIHIKNEQILNNNIYILDTWN